jgi:hypothetical protein
LDFRFWILDWARNQPFAMSDGFSEIAPSFADSFEPEPCKGTASEKAAFEYSGWRGIRQRWTVPQGSVKFPVSNFCPPWGRTDFYWEILAVAPSRRGDVQENHAACRGTHCCGRTAFRVRANFCGLEIGRGDRLLGGAWLRLVRCPVNTQFSNVGRGAGARRQDRYCLCESSIQIGRRRAWLCRNLLQNRLAAMSRAS